MKDSVGYPLNVYVYFFCSSGATLPFFLYIGLSRLVVSVPTPQLFSSKWMRLPVPMGGMLGTRRHSEF